MLFKFFDADYCCEIVPPDGVVCACVRGRVSVAVCSCGP